MTILLVDDSPLIISKIKEMLEDVNGITAIHSCGTYEEALELLQQHQPELALLDIDLPGKSGIDLLKYIKTAFPKTIVIMVSNQGDDSYKILSLRMSADHYIDKSKDFEDLCAVVASYCPEIKCTSL